VVIAGERHRVRPRIPEGEERERLRQEYAGMYPAAEEYREFTEREIPLIVLEPA
jgi:F420H(2)-dependent quinone reductase